MEYICLDNIKLIKNFVGCCLKTGFYLVNKEFYNLKNCKIINYKSISACLNHTKKKYLFESVNTLITTKKQLEINNNIDSIHFFSKKAFNLSEQYFNDFGIIDHYCCYNKGVVFK